VAGPRTGQRLNPAFVEWMMGLPAGWVTGTPGLTRNQQLRALGNGVVPQQAEAALRTLLAGEVAA
jgi:DNA (cytosine-5)-methyltransferase 1